MLNPKGWWLAVVPINLRCGIDRLLVLIGEVLDRAPTEGGAFVLSNRAGTRIRVLCVDAHRVWLCVRRLHESRFQWPRLDDAMCALSADFAPEHSEAATS